MRCIPPAAPPIRYRNLLYGLAGLFKGKSYVGEIEEEMRSYFGVRHLFLLGSGKAALFIILRALARLSPGKDEVLIPAYTCFSVPSAIVKAGLRVSACDVEENTFDFVYDHLEKTIRPKTLCVVSTHLFGLPARIERTLELCRRNGVFCVEDAAQAMGGKTRDRLLGTIGDVGFFSLGRGKNITCGGGGVILTDSDAIAREIERDYNRLQPPDLMKTITDYVKTFFMFLFIHPRYYLLPSRMPFLGLGETVFSPAFPVDKLCGMKAGLLRDWKGQLESSNSVRVENSGFYRERFGPREAPNPPSPCLRYPLMVGDRARREKLLESSGKRGLGLSRMYPAPVNEIAEIRGQFNGNSFPSARRVTDRLLTLPTHGFLAGKDREEICRLIAATRSNG